MPYLRVNADAKVKPEGFVAMRRPSDARIAIAEARKADAASAGSYEVEGMLLADEGKREEALNAYAKALELGSIRFQVRYRLAQLLWAGSRPADAQREASRSLALAATVAQRKMAQGVIASTNRTASTTRR